MTQVLKIERVMTGLYEAGTGIAVQGKRVWGYGSTPWEAIEAWYGRKMR